MTTIDSPPAVATAHQEARWRVNALITEQAIGQTRRVIEAGSDMTLWTIADVLEANLHECSASQLAAMVAHLLMRATLLHYPTE